MRKLFSLFVALLVTTSLWADDFQSGELYYNITSETTVEVSGAVSSITSAIIPETVTNNGTTYSVTSIGHHAFYDCYSLTSVTIPNSVTSIREWAFYWCSSLTSITIPNSVTSIGDRAFEGCSSLTSVTIPNNVTSIGQYAFCGTGIYNDESNWENNVLYIDNCLIEAKKSISGASTIKENTRLIGYQAFYNCSSLTSVTIPNSVKNIGELAFYGCSKLKSVAIPNSVTSIGESTFCDCSSLTSVTIPNSVTSIGEKAFYNCRSLTDITLGNSVTSLGNYAFDNCTSINTVVWNAKNCADFDSYEDPFGDISSQIRSFTFGDSVKHIPANLCYDMTNLTSLTIPNSVTSIGDFAFSGCSKLKSINIPENVTSIGNYAFNNCDSLTSITIPNSVTSIGDGAFSWCESLTSVVWNVKNCVDFDYDTSPFHCYWDNNDVASSITSFIFGDSVEYIPAYLCYLMQNLKSITIPDGVTSIGKNAFYDCDSLTSVTIGNSVTSIGEYAFYDCSSIDTVVWNAKNCADFEWSSSPFRYSNDSITSFSFGDSVKHIPAHLCEDKKNLISLTIPNSVTSIGGRAFNGCSSVTSLTLENNLTAIGSSAFSSLNALTSVTQKAPSIEAYCQGQVSKLLYDSASLNKNAIRTIEINGEEVADWVIPSSITKIEDYTFYNCPSITSVALPNTITSIGKSAFENCISIAAITIPNKVTRIGVRAFSKCPITDVIIPNNVTNIGGSAFSNCDKLSSLILGESVDSIGGGAFYGCRKLYDIYCYAPEPPYAIASGWNPSFENFNVNLYVPCDNLKAFQMDPVFGTFKYIHCIDSEDVPADGVIITPGFTDVTITWPTDDDADNYIIVIEKDGEVVCTLTFNSEGQLISIAFAPGRNGNRPAQYAEQTTNGYRFTITSLESGTKYGYNIEVKDASNKTIKSHSGEFTTQSTTAVDNITTSNANIQKIFRNGQLIILRDGVEYNVIGQEM